MNLQEGVKKMDKIRIAVDSLGGDNGAEYIVMGISEALSQYDDIEIIVTGDEKELTSYIEKYNCDKNRVRIINSTEVISCHDAPVEAIRKKKDSSLVLALKTVKDGETKAII